MLSFKDTLSYLTEQSNITRTLVVDLSIRTTGKRGKYQTEGESSLLGSTFRK